MRRTLEQTLKALKGKNMELNGVQCPADLGYRVVSFFEQLMQEKDEVIEQMLRSINSGFYQFDQTDEASSRGMELLVKYELAGERLGVGDTGLMKMVGFGIDEQGRRVNYPVEKTIGGLMPMAMSAVYQLPDIVSHMSEMAIVQGDYGLMFNPEMAAAKAQLEHVAEMMQQQKQAQVYGMNAPAMPMIEVPVIEPTTVLAPPEAVFKPR